MRTLIKLIVVIFVILLVVAVFIYINGYEGKGIQKPVSSSKKPVILIVIDSMMDNSLQKAIQTQKTPALEFLKNQGQYFPEAISAYPTMSVTIDSTILTGTYPDQHSLPGLVWYDNNENRFINYGSGNKEIMALGVKQVLKNGIINLNNQHLSKNVKTIHEELAKADQDSASINGLIYRGDTPHALSKPKFASILNLLPEDLVTMGPSLLSLGRLSQLNPKNKLHNRFWQRFGLNDVYTANELIYLIEKDQLPSFTFAYFPDPDKTVHKNGPMDLKGITKTDKELLRVLEAFGSKEEAIENATWIVMGDSGQSPIGDEKETALIDLRSIFDDFDLVKPGQPINTNDQLLLAVNERMAYIYLLDETLKFDDISDLLLADERIGFTAWKENDGIIIKSPEDNEALLVKNDGDYEDDYGQSWSIQGDPAVLDVSMNENQIQFGNYPDAFSRLYGSLFSHDARFLIVDAKPGHELISEKTPTHIGGAGHGSLHRLDSTAPMIIIGSEQSPDSMRHVDLKQYIMTLIQKNNTGENDKT
ncbi:alkaline phosphatase family protein [Alkalihalobacillus sp. AL-G]|uniref:alkaline phosphatase family protein n=1 Tax=Alkalihalobacillus sp. AL-G TaxID=2926399 RepID=UPI00272AFF88|nr:alkaline phosphatase family protein [Alkalihalobacillus sp. AL-G]WLD91599.1 alkaline phosphatase family protein [Alkalihalobacillus sp. AL-G]